MILYTFQIAIAIIRIIPRRFSVRAEIKLLLCSLKFQCDSLLLSFRWLKLASNFDLAFSNCMLAGTHEFLTFPAAIRCKLKTHRQFMIADDDSAPNEWLNRTLQCCLNAQNGPIFFHQGFFCCNSQCAPSSLKRAQPWEDEWKVAKKHINSSKTAELNG